jgi:hypothetical protein
LTGSTEKNRHKMMHPDWCSYMKSFGGNDSQKTTAGRLRIHKDIIKMDFRDTG